MKKFLVTLCAVSTLVSAQEAQNYASVGVAAVVLKEPFFTKDKTRVLYLPQINLNYYGLYVQDLEAGYKHDFGEYFFAGAYVRFLDGRQVKSSELKSQYRSIHNRDYQVAFGGKLGVNFDALEAFVYAQGGERGASYGAQASYFIPLTQKFSLIPSVSYDAFSREFSDYYFGVKHSELGGAINRTYKPGSAYALGARVTAVYAFENGIEISATAGASRFSDDISDSPIVRSRYEGIFYAGVSYRF